MWGGGKKFSYCATPSEKDNKRLKKGAEGRKKSSKRKKNLSKNQLIIKKE